MRTRFTSRRFAMPAVALAAVAVGTLVASQAGAAGGAGTAPAAAAVRPAAVPFARGLAVAREAPDNFANLHLFALTSTGHLVQSIETVGLGDHISWSPWSALDGQLTSIAAQTNFNRLMVLVGTTSDGTIRTRIATSRGAATFTPWTTLDGKLVRVALVHPRRLVDRLLLVGVNAAGQIFTRTETAPGSNTWGPWQQLDGLLTDIAVGLNADNTVLIAGVNSAGHIFTRTQTSPGATTWTPWNLLDGRLTRIAITHEAAHPTDLGNQSPESLHLVGVNSAQQVFNRVQTAPNSLTWTPWQQLDGLLTSVAGDAGDLELARIFGINAAGTVFERTQAANSSPAWTPWTQINTPLG